MTKTRTKYRYTEARQEGGDDGYCWAIFEKGNPTPIVTGLTRREVDYHRPKIEKSLSERSTETKASKAMEERAIQALRTTWHAIGHDCLISMSEGDIDEAEKISIPSDEVIDCVTSCGFTTGYPFTYGSDPEAVKWLEKQPEQEQNRICKIAFPRGRYGL